MALLSSSCSLLKPFTRGVPPQQQLFLAPPPPLQYFYSIPAFLLGALILAANKICFEHLLCVRHCSRCWGHASEQNQGLVSTLVLSHGKPLYRDFFRKFSGHEQDAQHSTRLGVGGCCVQEVEGGPLSSGNFHLLANKPKSHLPNKINKQPRNKKTS